MAANGAWGLLNVRLEGGLGGRMIQEFRQNGGSPDVLISWPENNPPLTFNPHIGDYQYLVAVENVFYGTFCGTNFPTADFNDLNDGLETDFPQGIVYQRNTDFPNRKLLDNDGMDVNRSIDPYFFRREALP